jgi:predicted acyltransferase
LGNLVTEPVKHARPRVLSVDLLRGATIALMILVNDPGDPQCVYPALRHADWNGYTLADLVFPNFLFLSGASLVFSLESRIRSGRTRKFDLARGLGRRTVNLLLLKLFVAHAPAFRFRRIRIFGVLFRTALLGLAGGLALLLTLSIPALLIASAALLLGYWLLLRVPLGSVNVPLLDPDNNAAAWLDRRIAHLLHGHLHSGALYNVTHDPEGLLSSLPALATVLNGAAAALWMRSDAASPERKAATLALAGAASLASGHAWSRSFPVNKNLWTSSYVLVSSGWSLLVLAGLYWLYDVRAEGPASWLRRLGRPLEIFGANALPVYVLSLLGHKTARTVHVHRDGHDVSLRTLAYRQTFGRRGSSPLGSLAFAAVYAGLCFVPNLLLWRKKIFIKI